MELVVIRLCLVGLFFSSQVGAWDAPWKYSSTPTSPWNSADRKEGRESFFAALGAKFENRAESQENKIPEPSLRSENQEPAERLDSKKDLSSIPWGAHRMIYPREKFSSKLEWPISGGRVTSGYGIRNGNFHEGLDIGAYEGAPIRAAASGRVVFSGTLNGYGNTLVIYHGDGMSTVYAHNASNMKDRGELVQKGSVIARVGHTGHAQGNHCHFEVRSDGKPVNPLQFSFSKNPLLAAR